MYDIATHVLYFRISPVVFQVEVPSHSLVNGDGAEEGEGLGDDEMQFHVEMEERGEAPLINDTLTAVLSRRPVMTSDMAEKLDIMMSICFEHFYSLCHRNSKKQYFKHFNWYYQFQNIFSIICYIIILRCTSFGLCCYFIQITAQGM